LPKRPLKMWSQSKLSKPTLRPPTKTRKAEP
jgi:hypothetical protein